MSTACLNHSCKLSMAIYFEWALSFYDRIMHSYRCSALAVGGTYLVDIFLFLF